LSTPVSEASSQQLTAAQLRDMNTKTQELILAETMARYLEKPDPTALFAISQANRATNLTNLRSIAADRVTPVLDRDATVTALKILGQAKFPGKTGTGIGQGADLINSAINYMEKSNNDIVSLATIPPDVAVVQAKALWQRLPADKKLILAQYLSSRSGTNYDQRFRPVQQQQEIVAQIGSAIGADLQQRMAKQVASTVSAERALLEQIRARQVQADEIQRRKDKLELDTQHLRASNALAGLVLNSIIPSAEAQKVTRIGDQLINIHSAVKQFGASGTSPDKLLMFTNVVTAGIAIYQILGPQPADPTMLALNSISTASRNGSSVG
jgi:hypothetical protein